MSIDRLTHRAKTALLELPKRESVMGVTVLRHIENAGGMGSYLVKSFPKLRYTFFLPLCTLIIFPRTTPMVPEYREASLCEIVLSLIFPHMPR